MKENWNMKPQIIRTADGSDTLYIPELNENYHSINGAIQESLHVFINCGLKSLKKEKLKIFEIGFGTGLNVLLTFIEALKKDLLITYHSIEKYPLENKLLLKLNYANILGTKYNLLFDTIHSGKWNTNLELSKSFLFKKIEADFTEFTFQTNYDLIYFDAFGPDVQPEMWSERNFLKIRNVLNPEGILTTYSSKSSVRKAMQSAGFNVEKLPGPPGKREIIRASVL